MSRLRVDNKRKRVLSRRSFLILIFQLFVFIAILVRFFYLQLMRGEELKESSKKNRTRKVRYRMARGIVYDRNMNGIIRNSETYYLVIQQQYADFIEEFLGECNLKLDNPYSIPIPRSKMKKDPCGNIIILIPLIWNDMSKLMEDMSIRGKSTIITGFCRYYPYSEILAHITGYSLHSLIIDQDIQKNLQDTKFGKGGIELQYENTLVDRPKIAEFEVNAKGVCSEIRQTIIGEDGASLVTTISVDIQKILQKNLENINGTIVIQKISSGEIIGMHSTPSFDPNIMVSGFPADSWEDFREKFNFRNKALCGLYPPGSTFKLITALAILESGKINPKRIVNCSGSIKIGNRVFHCWNKSGHGNVDINKAVSESCNIYFAIVGMEIGSDAIFDIAQKFGLGQNTGIDLPFEINGILPSAKWKKKKYKKEWTKGDTINLSIGQGYLAITPIQMVNMMSSMISGYKIPPRVIMLNNNINIPHLKKIQKSKNLEQQTTRNAQKINVQKENRSLILKSLAKNIIITNKDGAGVNVLLGGKTGTAQNKGEDHSLFLGFYPYENPIYSICILAENMGWGSKIALPMAAKVMYEIGELDQSQR